MVTVAAARASRLGAHRESAIHYGQALGFAELLPLDAEAALSSGRALELFLTTHFEEAVAAQEQALRCCEELGDPVGQGDGAAQGLLGRPRPPQRPEDLAEPDVVAVVARVGRDRLAGQLQGALVLLVAQGDLGRQPDGQLDQALEAAESDE